MIVCGLTHMVNIEGRKAPGGDKSKVVKMLNECLVGRRHVFSVIEPVLVPDSLPPPCPEGSRALPAVGPGQTQCKQSAQDMHLQNMIVESLVRIIMAYLMEKQKRVIKVPSFVTYELCSEYSFSTSQSLAIFCLVT